MDEKKPAAAKVEPKSASAAAAPMTQTVEAWAKSKGTPEHMLAAARVMNRWPIGRLLTEEQFDTGISNQPVYR